jgi:HSP20 family protein
MLALARWSPVGTVSSLRELDRELDRMFARLFDGEVRESSAWMPPVDCFTRDGFCVVRADLPGVNPGDIEVTLQGDQLTIRGERRPVQHAGAGASEVREVPYGAFERTLTVPQGIAPDRVRATYHQGVLEVSLPLPESLKPYRVPVAIEGQATAITA